MLLSFNSIFHFSNALVGSFDTFLSLHSIYHFDLTTSSLASLGHHGILLGLLVGSGSVSSSGIPSRRLSYSRNFRLIANSSARSFLVRNWNLPFYVASFSGLSISLFFSLYSLL